MLRFATKPQSIGQIWSVGIKLTRERIWLLYGLFIINHVILTGSMFFMGVTHNKFADNFKYHPFFMTSIIIGYAIVSLIIYAIGFYVLGGLMQGKTYTFMETVQLAIKKLPLLVLASLLSTLAIALGTVALLIPGIYIAIVMGYYFPSIIIDDMPIVAAFKYTFSIVWGHWWRAFIVIAVPIIVTMLVNGIFTAIVMVSSYYFQPEGSSHAAASYITEIFNILLQAYMDILILSIRLIQWNDLKNREQLKKQETQQLSAA